MGGIVVAPFSNSGIRDWPGSRYAALLRLLLDEPAAAEPIRLIGTRSQAMRAREIVRSLPGDRVVSLCGKMGWAEMIACLKGAACVIANNSGVAHLAGHFGVPTVSVFAGTHNRREWKALGPSVVLVSRSIGCSPCQFDHGQTSPYDKACLRQIEPAEVLRAVRISLEQAGTGETGWAG